MKIEINRLQINFTIESVGNIMLECTLYLRNLEQLLYLVLQNFLLNSENTMIICFLALEFDQPDFVVGLYHAMYIYTKILPNSTIFGE